MAKVTYKGVELHEDAIERLTRAMRVIGKAAPIHKPHQSSKIEGGRVARQRSKRSRNSSKSS